MIKLAQGGCMPIVIEAGMAPDSKRVAGSVALCLLDPGARPWSGIRDASEAAVPIRQPDFTRLEREQVRLRLKSLKALRRAEAVLLLSVLRGVWISALGYRLATDWIEAHLHNLHHQYSPEVATVRLGLTKRSVAQQICSRRATPMICHLLHA